MSDRGAAGKATDPDGVVSGARRRGAGGGAVVTVYEDGPLIVRGQFAITGQDGQLIPAGRRTVALCRCGRSAIKPFCDGSHARTGFRAPGSAQRTRSAEDRDGGRGTWQPAAGISDAAAQPAGHGEPAAD